MRAASERRSRDRRCAPTGPGRPRSLRLWNQMAFSDGTILRAATRDHPRRLPRSGQDRDAIPLCAAAVLAAFSLWRTCVVVQRLRRREARRNLLLAVLPVVSV